jgi:hypothetical protein
MPLSQLLQPLLLTSCNRWHTFSHWSSIERTKVDMHAYHCNILQIAEHHNTLSLLLLQSQAQ